MNYISVSARARSIRLNGRSISLIPKNEGLMRRLVGIGTATLTVCLAGCRGEVVQAGDQKKTTIAVIAGGADGPISGPLVHWKASWEENSGAEIELIQVPVDQFFGRVDADVARCAAGSKPEFDGVVIPAYLQGDLIVHDYV